MKSTHNDYPLTSDLAKKRPRRGSGLYYDPLYGYVALRPEIRRFLDLEVFQRLRGLKQLSTMYLVFPGAVHSRFEHSVGVAYLAGVVHDRLREGLSARGLDKKLVLNEITRASLQVSALLHDIGHGPFCHLFEMFCRRNPEFQDWDHEEFGLRLLRGEGSLPIFQQIPTSLSRLADSLQKEFPDSSPLLGLLKPQNVFNIAMGKAPDLGNPNLNSQYQFLKA